MEVSSTLIPGPVTGGGEPQVLLVARDISAPICQDTGTPVVWIHHPVGASTRALKAEFETAVREAA